MGLVVNHLEVVTRRYIPQAVRFLELDVPPLSEIGALDLPESACTPLVTLRVLALGGGDGHIKVLDVEPLGQIDAGEGVLIDCIDLALHGQH